jgi:hypothetical protein
MKRRPRAKQNFAKLISESDKAKLEFNKNMEFRKFVLTWNSDAVELLGWSLSDFYRAYQKNGVQLVLSF